ECLGPSPFCFAQNPRAWAKSLPIKASDQGGSIWSLQRTALLRCDCPKHRPWRAWTVTKQHPSIGIAAQFPGRLILGPAFETVFPLCRSLGGVKETVSGSVQPTGHV